MTSRLYLKRFQPPEVEVTESNQESQEILDALAACTNQTTVETDLKVSALTRSRLIIGQQVVVQDRTLSPVAFSNPPLIRRLSS